MELLNLNPLSESISADFWHWHSGTHLYDLYCQVDRFLMTKVGFLELLGHWKRIFRQQSYQQQGRRVRHLQEILTEPFPKHIRRKLFQFLSQDRPDALSCPCLIALLLSKQRRRKESREGGKGEEGRWRERERGKNTTTRLKQRWTSVRNKGYFCIKWKYKRSVFTEC